MTPKQETKNSPQIHESGAKHEEGVTSSLTLAPPYYSYTSLLTHTPPKTPN